MRMSLVTRDTRPRPIDVCISHAHAHSRASETSSSVVCGAKERTDVGAELGTDDLVGAELGEVRNSSQGAKLGVSHQYCTSSRQCNLGAKLELSIMAKPSQAHHGGQHAKLLLPLRKLWQFWLQAKGGGLACWTCETVP